jgi:hypothetical protein
VATPCTATAYLTGYARKGGASAPGAPVRGTPTGFRLEPVCPDPCAAAYTVPAKQRLAVTDIVFGNPAGDAGLVQLTRNGSPILVESLDGFRDLDLHFVAPTVLAAGDRLGFTVECANPAGADGVVRPCAAGVYVGAFLQPAPAPANARRRQGKRS